MIPTLHPYQAAQKTEVSTAWAAGARNVLAVLPTGGGKSVEVGSFVRDWDTERAQNIVIAHRQELVGQMSLHVARAEVKHRIIAPKAVIGFITAEHRREFGRSFIDPTARTAVAGVDTLISRKVELAGWAIQCNRWVTDEAHHLLQSNKWGHAVEMFPNAFGLGVTATPQRADGKGLGRHADGVFDHMVVGPTMRELIDMGNLTEYEIVLPVSDFDLNSLKLGESGDYSPKSMREASKQSKIVGDVVQQYMVHAFGKSGIVFATDVETANEMAEKFRQSGIPSQAVSANTPDNVRAEFIRRFRNREIWVLVNVDLFGEGFDLPAIEVVSMARPTASLAVYLQQFGRALRILPGKFRGLVIDHVSNVKRHGLPDRPRYWTLDARERRSKRAFDPDEIEVKQCLNCFRAFEGVKRCCPYCGWSPVVESGRRAIEVVEGDLTLLDAETLAAMRKATELPNPAAMPIPRGATQIVAVGIQNRQRDKIMAQQLLAEAIAQWAAYERQKGRPDDETYRRFYLATRGIDVAGALHADKTRAEYDELRAVVEGWFP